MQGFHGDFNKFNNTGVRILDSIYLKISIFAGSAVAQ